MSLVAINSLEKSFDEKVALHDINIHLPKGRIVGLVGPDGAGKTTLIRLIAGLLKPTKGTITVDSFDTIKESHKVHERIGYMPQRFGLYEDLSVIQNLTLYADLRGVKGEERHQSFEKLLAFTALEPFKKRLAKDLSGGMKQKLGLACALIKKPMLLLLDEPSVGVDPISRRELWKMVGELISEGITAVWSTAYLDEAEKCPTVLLLNEGKLLYNGPPEKFTERVEGRVFLVEAVREARRELQVKLLKDENIVDAVIHGSGIRIVTKKKGYPASPVEPRFEDAFIDFLGGVAKGESPLVAKMHKLAHSKQMMIESRGLTKRFGDFIAADQITLSIPQGEIFGLLGPNGAGKTTTFKMMCGLLKPTSGKSFVNGKDLQGAPGIARACIGYMAQKFSLYGNLSVQQNLEFFSGIYGLAGKKKKEAITEMIEVFELNNYLDVLADILPLGFKQRLALSCSLMHRPAILFLDEPTSGVDPITRREFWLHIYGLVKMGMTIMVTTHFMDEAEYCDRLGLVYQSKMIEMDTPEALKEKARAETLEDAFIQLVKNHE